MRRPFADGFDLTVPEYALRRRAVRHRFRHHAADQLARWLLRQAQELRRGRADIGVADRQGVDIARL